MNLRLVPMSFLLLASTLAAQPAQQPAHGGIHGLVIDPSGEPARGVTLRALPLGGTLATALPETKTDQDGRFRFINLGWWGRYTVYAADLDAGYSEYSTRPRDSERLQEVTLSSEHPEAEFNFHLPPPAGFLHFVLRNRKTGESIHGVEVDAHLADKPDQFLFSIGCSTDRPILVPADTDLLLHITSWGFEEWSASLGMGKPSRVPSGAHVTLEVLLDPAP